MSTPSRQSSTGEIHSEARRRFGVWGELALAIPPTIVVLIVMALVEALSRQRLLFASLASSAFLIYLDPNHGANRTRTLVVSQLLGAVLGYGADALFGPGYAAAGTAMVAQIVLMILLDAVHPPAVSTAFSFAFRTGTQGTFMLFVLAVGLVAILVGLQRYSMWAVRRLGERMDSSAANNPGARAADH